MAISAKDVKELREITGAGMMDCKKALTETDGDKDKAVDWLRENGLAKAAKKANRIAAEGIVKTVVADDNKSAAIVEVNSETDFVAKNEKFQTYVEGVAKQVLAGDAKDMDSFMASNAASGSQTIEAELAEMTATIGEKLSIRRFEKVVTDGMVVSYIHAGGKIGVLVEAATNGNSDAIKEALKNVAMQVAAMNPKYTTQAEVDADYMEKEKEILTQEAKNDPKNAGKPDNIIEKMIIGRLNKEMKEICLVDQVYVKAEDGKQSVAKYIESVAKAEGVELSIKRFIRFETGEGLEKKNEDFAAEVAAQLK
ncbi:MAG: translation elongation factor Ts [Lachnospiraceae bacterium]|nr:translation elongation factor Ts [Lachnospiraceae bacterium]